MSEQGNAKVMSSHDYHWAGIYAELSERYGELPATKAAPYMAVRLLVMRHGFDSVMTALGLKGTAWVAERARNELTLRQEFVARMVVDFPPEDPADVEEAVQEMATDLAGIDCPEGGLRLLNYLERLRLREARFTVRSKTVH